MYFAYLTFPPFPEALIPACMENIKLIDTDPRLIPLNQFRGKMNRATILPKETDEWLVDNIAKKLFDVVPEEMKRNLLNYTVYQNYWKREETWGTHPKHVDIGRNWAINYYITTGGTDTRISWYKDDILVTETQAIEPGRWCLLKTDEMHAVRGIEPEYARYFLTVSLNVDSLDRIMPYVVHETIL